MLRSRAHARHFIALLAVAAGIASCKSRGAANADSGWLTYNRGYDGERYADLNEITRDNVAGLKPLCEVNLGEEGSFQSGPLVLGDTLVVTTPHSTVALNAGTCALIWRQIIRPDGKDVFPVNRGAGFLDGRIYRGTADGRLLALDEKTGNVVWQQRIGNPDSGEFVSSAPIAHRGVVYVGIAGSDWGVRGRMMAFDAGTGKERWRFNTIPMGTEAGAETWTRPQTALRGGGAQW